MPESKAFLGKGIRRDLLDRELTITWLVHQVEKRGGDSIDLSVASKFIRGTRGGDLAERWLVKAREVIDDYAHWDDAE